MNGASALFVLACHRNQKKKKNFLITSTPPYLSVVFELRAKKPFSPLLTFVFIVEVQVIIVTVVL